VREAWGGFWVPSSSGKRELAFRRTEVAGGDAEGVFKEASRDQRGAHYQGLYKGGASAVQPDKGDAQRARGEGRCDDLVVQVAAQHGLHVLIGQLRLIHGVFGAAAHHFHLRQLPALLPEKVVLQHRVEPACQWAAPLLGADDAGVGNDGGGMLVEKCLLSDMAHSTHPLTSQ